MIWPLMFLTSMPWPTPLLPWKAFPSLAHSLAPTNLSVSQHLAKEYTVMNPF